jgi:sulfoxide reductase heme-binding subunit YedZ
MLMRSTGLVALLLLTCTAVLGVLATAPVRRGRALLQGVHADVALLAVLLVVVHVVTAVLDAHAGLHLVDVVVPFGSEYRPVAVGLGTLAVDLLLAVLLTSALRLRLGARAWRGVHVLAYAAWPVSAAHGVGAGSDAATPLGVGLTATCTAAVLAALVWRASVGPSGLRLAAVLVGLVLVGGGAGWAVDGPLAVEGAAAP